MWGDYVMENVWQGKHFWIWAVSATFNGDLNKIIAKIKETGSKGVLIKSHDGATIWNQFRSSVKAFKDAGLTVGAWGYHYGKDVQGEARAVLDAISAGADWYVIDAEIEYERQQAKAAQLGSLIRAVYPTFPIGYSTFPFVNVHTAFPYKEFSAFCNVTLPQIYWGELAPSVDVCVQRTFDMYKKFGLPVAPVGQTYTTKYVPTDKDFVTFEKISKDLGASGVSFWSLQHATGAMFNSVKAMNFSGIVATPDPVAIPIDPLANVSSWAKASVVKAIESGLLTSMLDGDFHPKDPITREMLATILDRANVLDSTIKPKEMN
jgi:hypothetical protein